MADRHYLPEVYADKTDRAVYLKDLSTHLMMSGVVFQGVGTTVVLLTPSSKMPSRLDDSNPDANLKWAQPTLEEWGEIIRQSDDPEIFVGEEGGLRKVLHRKQRYAISGAVQQKIWVRDSFTCVYCGALMGEALMTIDHFVPLEMGGANDASNYVTACRRDNKQKGMMHPKEFCEKHGYDYTAIERYVKGK